METERKPPWANANRANLLQSHPGTFSRFSNYEFRAYAPFGHAYISRVHFSFGRDRYGVQPYAPTTTLSSELSFIKSSLDLVA